MPATAQPFDADRDVLDVPSFLRDEVAPGRPATIWACRRSFSRRLSGTRSRTPPARGHRPHWRGDHFQVILATPGFTGLPLVEQHRAVNDALAEHFRDGTIHELRIRTKGTTLNERATIQDVIDSEPVALFMKGTPRSSCAATRRARSRRCARSARRSPR